MNVFTTDPEMRTMLNEVVVNATKDLERSGTVPPLGIMMGKGRPPGIMPLRFDDAETKRESVSMLGAIAKNRGYDFVIVLSESWMTSHPIEEQDKEHPPPSEDPKRTEALIVCMKHRDGSEVLVVVPFARGEDGKITSFGERQQFDGANVHMGMMEDIFPQEHSTH
jgi:hypothetical protein